MKSLQKEQNGTNLRLWPPIYRIKPAITPKWFNSLDTNSITRSMLQDSIWYCLPSIEIHWNKLTYMNAIRSAQVTYIGQRFVNLTTLFWNWCNNIIFFPEVKFTNCLSNVWKCSKKVWVNNFNFCISILI